jgi:hypothetical protein
VHGASRFIVRADVRSAGMMPWIARDLMQWPVAVSGQGVIDIVVQSIVSLSQHTGRLVSDTIRSPGQR